MPVPEPPDGQQRVMTFNLRYDNPGDGLDSWTERRHDVSVFIIALRPDFLGCQEALWHQVEYLNKTLEPLGYRWFGVGRDDGKKDGEFNPIFYNAQKYTLLKESVFWLSLTPEDPGTKFPGAGCNRICQYGHFEENSTKRSFWYFNTHLDNVSEDARDYSSKLICDRIKELVTDATPYFLTGDFNCQKRDSSYKDIILSPLSDSEDVAKRVEPGRTFIGFDNKGSGIIDFIFVAGTGSVFDYHVDRETRPNGRYLSDHRPVHIYLQILP